MKTLLIFCTMLTLSLSAIAQKEKSIEQFYYLEASCENCDLQAEGVNKNFYVVTSHVGQLTSEEHAAFLVESFKSILQKEFANANLLFEKVRIQKGKKKEALRRAKNSEREMFLKKGYHVQILRG